MTTLDKLAKQMRQDWDRRVGHDYRFWMSDGHHDDRHMWETGERDFDVLARGIQGGPNASALEIGCGVGRLIRPAAKRFGRVIGFDVSERAIAKARELLADTATVELVVGDGIGLNPVPDESIDFVWSFASLTSMPTRVIASYLRDMRRVLKPAGVVRLQVYLGQEVLVSEQDTLHLRCFTLERFTKGVEAAGFELEHTEELVLPFQVSFKELGIEAFVVSIRPAAHATVRSVDEIARELLPEGENPSSAPSGIADLAPSDLEAWMTINYANELVDQGDAEKAQAAIDYVTTHLRSSTIDTRDVLDRIAAVAERGHGKGNTAQTLDSVPAAEAAGSARGVESDFQIFDRNMAVLRVRFPDLYVQVSTHVQNTVNSAATVTIVQTLQGPTVWKGSHCLDHVEKPKGAADAWVVRSFLDKRVAAASSIVVFGFGGGYHLESLLERPALKISCIEPDIDVFLAALRSRDLTQMISKLFGLAVGQRDNFSFITPDSELLVRPQSMALTPEDAGHVRSIFYGRRGLTALHPKMAVLGPIEGGTIPIGQYTFNALTRGGQRVRGLDMSGFGSGFYLLDGFVNLPQRRNALHGAYVEMLSMVLLEAFNEKPVDILICMAQAPISPRVLTELRKRGVITVLWFVEDYLRFTYWREMAQYYDFIFTIQKGDCIDQLKKAGAGEVHYLPTACDPNFHRPMALTTEEREQWGSPISFVGAGYHNRQQMFASLSSEPFRIWGSEWPRCKPFDRMVQEDSRRISPEEYIKIFNATDINLNLHSSMERDGVDPFGDFLNPRTFELASCGAFQLVDERTLLSECFKVGEEIITFNSLNDLREKIDYYRRHPEERAEIANRARARVLRDHTYDQRMAQMLSIVYASKFEQLRLREEASPWSKMLQRAAPYPELHERCKKAFERGEEPILDGLISDIVTGDGTLSETEQKLLFLYHVRKQIIRMTREEAGEKN